MRILLKGGKVYTSGGSADADVLIEDGIIKKVQGADGSIDSSECETVDCAGYVVVPGLTDVHVHFREPGFEYKETIATGARAAAAGGYTTVCTMPNLDPAPWDIAGLKTQTDAIKKDACVRVLPYGRITRPAKETDDPKIEGRAVADLEEMAPYVVAYSDDGIGVQQDELMEQAMLRAKDLGKLIVAHCEDTNYAPEDPRSEYKQIERDLGLVAKTGCSYHVCHVSAKESVDLIRQAKARGLDVTCETAPHYLIYSKEDIMEKMECLEEKEHGRFKMNPPIRGKDDKQALLTAIADGTIDMIATDHAPHSAEEKSKGFAGSLNGILGLEAAFPVMYTSLVETKIISLERLIELMSIAPARRFGLCGKEKQDAGADGQFDTLVSGARADITVIDLNEAFTIDPEKFMSKGRSTPFSGMAVRGKIKYTIADGKIVFANDQILKSDLR